MEKNLQIDDEIKVLSFNPFNMTLKDAFREFSLTDGQEKLIEELEEFFQNRTPCFILKGYAGTGKTFMMKGVTDWLAYTRTNFVIAAPTGRAAKVISGKTKHKAYTIHKTIYSNTDLREFKVKDEDGTETFKFYYEIRNNEDSVNTVYIIDEASMISNVYSEGEFFRFGSGYLLKDLIAYINFDNNDHSKKIIFIGDSAQLPPVNMNFSPALDAQYLQSNFLIDTAEFELTDVIRQKQDSGILENATKLRESLKNNLFNKLDINTGFHDITPVKHEDFLATYLKACNNQIEDETIIVAYSNASVKEYNDFIRSYFFNGQSTITPGDKIILVANNYNYLEMELLNGDFGMVRQVEPVNEVRRIKIKRKSNLGVVTESEVMLNFRNAVIEFTDVEDVKHDIRCKIIENILNSNQPDLSPDELKAIYIDFKIRNKNLDPGTKPFKDALRSDPYFNALRTKYGYAVTCHKAQGGEWKNTLLNCKTTMGYFNSSYFRWLYTGITRAKEHLFTLDEPHFSPASLIKTPKQENIVLRKEVMILKDQALKNEVPFQFPDNNALLPCIYLAVREAINDSQFKINNIKHTSYLEHYTISLDNVAAIFKIHYNKLNKITRIEKPLTNNPLVESVFQLLIPLENKTIILSEYGKSETEQVVNLNFNEPFQEDFYNVLKNRLETAKIRITDIDHKPYHEIYQFRREGVEAFYKFWYDSKKIFGKTEIIPGKTTGLTDEINACLKSVQEELWQIR